MAFIDIHGHYAWDIDDGMPSLEDAKKALEKAKNNRISTIVATPHVVSGKHTLKDLEIIKDRIHCRFVHRAWKSNGVSDRVLY